MVRNAIAAAAALLAISGAALGRASYPQYTSEVGIIHERYDYAWETVGTHFYFSTHQPAVALDEWFPNQLQPTAQKCTVFGASYGELEHGEPMDVGERLYAASVVDYARRDIGLSASYADGRISSLDLDEQSWSLGLMVNKFPHVVCEIGCGSYRVAGGGAVLSSDSCTVALGGYVETIHLWWEAAAKSSWSSDLEDYTTVQASAILYLSNAIGVGASIAQKTPESSEEETWLALGLDISLRQLAVHLGAQREAKPNGDTEFSVSVGYRY